MVPVRRHWRLWTAAVVIAAGFAGALAQSQPTVPPIQQAAAPRVATPQSVDDLIHQARGSDAAQAAAARRALRMRGQPAIDALMTQPELPTDAKLQETLDAVAQQKDARRTGLYWYTDLDAAIAAAQRDHKPILSLRLLGNLTDELSCANSRFFRTTLYPNAVVRDLLRERFVLHWQSVRAVPIVTIDFGDGRRLQRTITGNSLHMVLDEHGRAVDVLPGLYAASEFLRVLEPATTAARKFATVADDDFAAARAQFHTERLAANQTAWREICQQARLTGVSTAGIDHPPAIWTQARHEVPLHVLDSTAQQAVAERATPAEVASRLAVTKAISETPLMRLVRNVTQIIGEDSLRNEYYLHTRIHQQLAAPTGNALTRDSLVTVVYAQLFLNPIDDPWYGLSRPDVFSALKDDGRIHAPSAQHTGD